MKTVGIIAEYDPFHSGHAWQLDAARAAGAKKIIVCLSTAATQRGALPLLPEDARVKAALSCGADLVISLPAPYACAGAEAFASAGVALLSAAGCDTLVFGAEMPNTNLLFACAKALRSAEYQTALKEQLANGARNFASARQAALASAFPNEVFAELLSHPNNNLSIEYCKAILAQNAPLLPYALPRMGANHGQALYPNDHLATEVCPKSSTPSPSLSNTAPQAFASGSALRALWQTETAHLPRTSTTDCNAHLQNAHPIAPLERYLRPEAFFFYKEAYQNGLDTSWQKVDIALLSRLRAMKTADFAKVRGVREGLEYRLADALQTATTANTLYDALTTVRYPRARMRRLCLDAALGFAEGAFPALPPYLHILGGHKESLGILKNSTLPHSGSLFTLSQISADCAAVAHAQAAATDFAQLCQTNTGAMGAAFTKKIIVF